MADAALEVIRHHRLLEAWLVQTLGYSWDEVHEEAERLEHVISEDFERRIAAAMGHPTRDPHGELIPTEDLKMPVDKSTPLSSLRPGQNGVVICVKAAQTWSYCVISKAWECARCGDRSEGLLAFRSQPDRKGRKENLCAGAEYYKQDLYRRELRNDVDRIRKILIVFTAR
jgi:hypothetical protein